MSLFKKLWNWFRALPRRYQIGGGIVLVVVLVLGFHFLTRSAATTDTPSTTPHVSVKSAADLSSGAGPLALTGKVTSLNQATILAQTSGEIVSLSVKIGDQVGAGQQLGAFENSSESAQVTQAQGAYNAAVAARDSSSPVNTDASARDAYASAYATNDSTLHDEVDLFFGPQTPYGPQFIINNFNGIQFSRRRSDIDHMMDTWKDHLDTAANTDPATLLAEAYANTQTVATFVTDIANAARESDSRASAEQLAAISAAQATINGELSTLSAAQAAYQSKNVGGSAGADATVMQALGALQAAKAGLAKTIIRSPVSGTVVSLPITQGDFVSAFSMVAEVSNPSALQIDTQVTPADAKTIAVGSKAVVDGTVDGVIADISPAVDPSTSKIPVKVDLSSGAGNLVDGDTVTVSLDRTVAVTTATTTSAITIPIVATKITPNGPVVFTVSSSTLAAHPIVLGTILGDQVTVTSGITADLLIVTDARGLSDGETVIVDTP